MENNREKIILEAIKDARKVQDFLWGEESLKNKDFDIKDWIPLFQKRIDKLIVIDNSKKNYKIEIVEE